MMDPKYLKEEVEHRLYSLLMQETYAALWPNVYRMPKELGIKTVEELLKLTPEECYDYFRKLDIERDNREIMNTQRNLGFKEGYEEARREIEAMRREDKIDKK